MKTKRARALTHSCGFVFGCDACGDDVETDRIVRDRQVALCDSCAFDLGLLGA